MASNPLSEFISGVKSIAIKVFAKKIDGSYEAIKSNESGALKVSVADAIPAGTNNIGDVDLASPIPAGSNLIGKVSIDQVTAGANAVTLTGSNIPDTTPIPQKRTVKHLLTTIANAVSVASGANTGLLPLGTDGTETEVWVTINIDKQPWTASARGFWATGDSAVRMYPVLSGIATAYSDLTAPALSLVTGVAASAQGLTAPANINDAKALSLPIMPTATIKVINSHATDPATITVKVIRIWR